MNRDFDVLLDQESVMVLRGALRRWSQRQGDPAFADSGLDQEFAHGVHFPKLDRVQVPFGFVVCGFKALRDEKGNASFNDENMVAQVEKNIWNAVLERSYSDIPGVMAIFGNAEPTKR